MSKALIEKICYTRSMNMFASLAILIQAMLMTRVTTDYYTFVRENLVTWRRKKQDVSKISAEAEYRVMTHTACEMMWLKKTCCLSLILDSLNLCLFCDNSLLPISQNPVFRESTKHIEVDCHLIRDVWTKKVISLLFTPSSK